MVVFYLTLLLALGLLVVSYRFASSAPASSNWLKSIPFPKWGDFFSFAGLMSLSTLLILTFFVQIKFVPSASMEPGLMPGTKILVKPSSFGLVNPFTGSHVGAGQFSDLKHGDVVTAKFAYNPDVQYIKRVIALPGDTISIERDGYRLNDKYIAFKPTDTPMIYDVELGDLYYQVKIDPDKEFTSQESVTVPEGFVYMLGDNLTKSSDSREIGFIPLQNIIGAPY